MPSLKIPLSFQTEGSIYLAWFWYEATFTPAEIEVWV